MIRSPFAAFRLHRSLIFRHALAALSHECTPLKPCKSRLIFPVPAICGGEHVGCVELGRFLLRIKQNARRPEMSQPTTTSGVPFSMSLPNSQELYICSTIPQIMANHGLHILVFDFIHINRLPLLLSNENSKYEQGKEKEEKHQCTLSVDISPWPTCLQPILQLDSKSYIYIVIQKNVLLEVFNTIQHLQA